jgi:hypothetical protein
MIPIYRLVQQPADATNFESFYSVMILYKAMLFKIGASSFFHLKEGVHSRRRKEYIRPDPRQEGEDQ